MAENGVMYSLPPRSSSAMSNRVAKLANLYEDMAGMNKANGRMLRDIRVYCRVRPITPEQDKSNYNIIRATDDFTVAVQTQLGNKEYQYDAVFTKEHSQEHIFGEVNKLVRSAVDGFKVCVFAYGQSGSGKTFTMIGDKEQTSPGIIPRSFKAIYNFIEENKTNYTFTTTMYMMELYRDNLFDLLAKTKGQNNLDIRKDKSGMVMVQGSVTEKANSSEQLFEIFERGLAQRHVSSSQTKYESSRSHLVVSVIIESKSKFSGEIVRGKLTLVDLAASTRGTSKAPLSPEQMKEFQCINKSLSALSDVISALSSEQAFVPYRNNKLSMLMQDSFGGNAKTVMFVNVHPGEHNCDETVTALSYASRVKQITSDASRNSDNKEVTRLREEIELLQGEVRKYRDEISYLRSAAVDATKAELSRSAELTKTIENLIVQNDKVSEELRCESQKVADLTRTIEEVVLEKKEVEEKLSNEQQKVSALTKSVEDLNQENKTTNDTLTEERESYKTQMKEMLESFNNERETMMAERRKITKQFDTERQELKSTIDDLNSQVKSLSENLKDEQHTVVERNTTIDELTIRNNTLTKNFEQERKDLINQNKTLTENFNSQKLDFEKSIDALNLKIKTLTEYFSCERLLLENSIDDLNNKNKTLIENFSYERLEFERSNDELNLKIKTLTEYFSCERLEYEKSIDELNLKNKTYCENFVNERKELERNIDDLIAEVETERKSVEGLNNQIEALSEKVSSERRLRRKYYNIVEDMKGKVRVYCRVRPLTPSELKRNNHEVTNCPDEETVIVKTARGPKDYQFNGVYTQEQSQDELFKDISKLIQSAVDGYNVCVFAHGQTGSGKTYTMVGDKEKKNPGIIPRSFQAIYDLIEEDKNNSNFTTSIYMLELYRDSLIDLFANDRHPATLEIRKDKKHKMVSVQGAVVKSASSAEELTDWFNAGFAGRHVASTKMNADSSRSHLITTIIIQSTNKNTGNVVKGKLCFVDLAGTNRANKTESTPEQLKEAQYINKSLNALGDVVSALSSDQPYIPYRNDKLTMLMQDSMGGNAKTLMFVNVSPAEYNCDETVTSLAYASRVKQITNNAIKYWENGKTEKSEKSEKSDLSSKSSKH